MPGSEEGISSARATEHAVTFTRRFVGSAKIDQASQSYFI
jgi:hypothetical protein